jgi:uncharacterized metal-binding protein
MTENFYNLFETLTKEEKLKVMNDILGGFVLNSSESEKMEIMMSFMPKIMAGGMPIMKDMCSKMMGMNFFDNNRQSSSSSSCCGSNEDSIYETKEIKSLFEDWANAVKEEIKNYVKDNTDLTKEKIAEHFKLSLESLNYFIKDIPNEAKSCGCPSSCSSSQSDLEAQELEIIHIEKTKNICPMCETYADKEKEKPIVVMSCEGACLRGEISRQVANIVCHSLSPENTVRLCLGGAFTKDGGQRNLVKNAKRLVALEGCFIECASRMIKGVVPEANPEIITTDKLFDFDKNIFGINEMSEEEIKFHANEVAKKVVDMVK